MSSIVAVIANLPHLPAPPPTHGVKSRSAVIATADEALRHALVSQLCNLRWAVREAGGAAEMFALLDEELPALCILDSWLPDLEVRECVRELRAHYGSLDLLAIDGTDIGAVPARGVFRAEALHALRQAQDRMDQQEPNSSVEEQRGEEPREAILKQKTPACAETAQAASLLVQSEAPGKRRIEHALSATREAAIPEFIGSDPRMLEVSRRIRLVAHRKTAVLVHGPTGTGKELVARAIHRLSGRPAEKFIAINCAAIPEALVEAELFGHARGAFTGATNSRIGRIEAAAGGTLFLDEIGELPLPVQSKLLRFLESGEIQRVGENEAVRIDARVVAATHRKLGAMAAEGTFRLDLLHRISVFLVQTPPLAGRHADIDALIAHTLGTLGADEPAKYLSPEAREKLHDYGWPGNVRELEHTLERAWILSDDSALIEDTCVDFGEALL
jgi:DNA-binding NtrC family response regulator